MSYTINKEEKSNLIDELVAELHGHIDGSRKNIIIPECPYCGHTGGKFGIYIGPDVGRKKTFMTHCFSCGHTTVDINQFLEHIGRSDLEIKEHVDFGKLEVPQLFSLEDDELDDSLVKVDMPDGYKRCFRNSYLKDRGFTYDDYDCFPVGTTRGLNFKFDDYVIFPIINDEMTVGYVSRHTWSKSEIEEHNKHAKRNGKYQILRYRNSTENDFIKLLYNYDSIVEDETDIVVLTEGIFDAISLTRKLELYDDHSIVPIATFGKKISDTQMLKLQDKGVRTVVIGYDSDATESINKAAQMLSDYFDVFIAKIDSDGKDWDEMSYKDIYHTFAYNLMTPVEFKLQTVQV